MSKKLEVVLIDDCDIDDVCWVILKHETKPVFGTIVKKHEAENAIQIMTNNIGFRTVPCNHAFWNEEDAKKYRKMIKK